MLWLLWANTDKQMDEAFAMYEKCGVAGVKIDFMDRNDQEMVNFYHRVGENGCKTSPGGGFSWGLCPGWSQPHLSQSYHPRRRVWK